MVIGPRAHAAMFKATRKLVFQSVVALRDAIRYNFKGTTVNFDLTYKEDSQLCDRFGNDLSYFKVNNDLPAKNMINF